MKLRIPVAKPFFSDEEARATAEVLRSGWVTQGPRVAEFERLFAAAVGAPHAVAVTSCTTALHLALLHLGIGPGDEVLVPSLSFIATANVVRHCGATPVFVDVDPRTLNLDPRRLEPALSPRVRAVLPVHQLGMPFDVETLAGFARAHGLAVLEDAACAIGSRLNGRPVGSLGDLACFSFHPRKVLTTGEGGMIVTRDAVAAERFRRLRHHGMSTSDLARHEAAGVVVETYEEAGYNYRMTDLQAAVGIVQLGRLPEILALRRALARRYDEAFARLPGVSTPYVPPGWEPNYQTYVLRIAPGARLGRDAFMARMAESGIATRRGLMASHREPCYRDLPPRVPLPETERAADETVVLPLYPSMTDEEREWVVTRVCEALG
ncbi:MAG: DegT/DnrJ/EryC1/StrS family aminotransferase [Planctomycetes bacterium]|nr:DegT/DnrJ/EryC1/StrS family aminotransferase [Planctomycetota bacterium]